MHRLWWAALATFAIASLPVAAEPTEIGGWFGPRLFSSSSRLGYIDDAPAHPELQNGIAFGARAARRFLPWLVPELEIEFAPTSTNSVGGAPSASVLWFEPRLHIRFELWPDHRIQPFLVVGGGSPVTISGANKTFANSIVGDGYFGAGVRLDTGKGFGLRFDARMALLPSQPGSSVALTPELDIGFGLEFVLGRPRPTAAELARLAAGPPPPDRDGDGISDTDDACPDRPEDFDGFEDEDGCPDIDNDLDRVLDIADRCPNEPETYNGFQDEDGCPDRGKVVVTETSIEILDVIYFEYDKAVILPKSYPILDAVAATMQGNPSIQLIEIQGHTDERGDDAYNLDLSDRRAKAVMKYLVDKGVAEKRLTAQGYGETQPLDRRHNEAAWAKNRRVAFLILKRATD
jgi:outer membrane protein OmpA-like peptidoglycan-associated protein